MAKYKVGDQVVLVNSFNEYADSVEEMKEYLGAVATITIIAVECDENQESRYRIDIDASRFVWYDSMIDGLYTPPLLQ